MSDVNRFMAIKDGAIGNPLVEVVLATEYDALLAERRTLPADVREAVEYAEKCIHNYRIRHYPADITASTHAATLRRLLDGGKA